MFDIVTLAPTILQLALDPERDGVWPRVPILRLLRLFKTCRVFRLIRLFKDLYILAAGLLTALQALVWASALLCIFLYTGAVFCTVIIGQSDDFSPDNSRVAEYEEQTGDVVNAPLLFGSVLRSMLTLMQIVTLDNWSGVVRPILETHQPWMFIFFLGFIMITTYGLLNLLVGLVVSNACALRRENDSESKNLSQSDTKQIVMATKQIFHLVDTDQRGYVDIHSLRKFLFMHDVIDLLQKHLLVLNPTELLDLLDICKVVANDEKLCTGKKSLQITIDDFVDAVLKLSSQPGQKYVLEVGLHVQRVSQQIEKIQTSLDDQVLERFKSLQSHVDAKLNEMPHIVAQRIKTSSHASQHSTDSAPNTRKPLQQVPPQQLPPQQMPWQAQPMPTMQFQSVLNLPSSQPLPALLETEESSTTLPHNKHHDVPSGTSSAEAKFQRNVLPFRPVSSAAGSSGRHSSGSSPMMSPSPQKTTSLNQSDGDWAPNMHNVPIPKLDMQAVKNANEATSNNLLANRNKDLSQILKGVAVLQEQINASLQNSSPNKASSSSSMPPSTAGPSSNALPSRAAGGATAQAANTQQVASGDATTDSAKWQQWQQMQLMQAAAQWQLYQYQCQAQLLAQQQSQAAEAEAAQNQGAGVGQIQSCLAVAPNVGSADVKLEL